ncbi:MAG TPA: hypothetical protein VN731_10055 [Rhodanobacter sp.]|nr:hypothetical protein [Rhodanobacter sp.]
MELKFGVVDVAYSDAGKVTTTGDVAEYLEERYHVMRSFLELNEEDIGQILVDQVAGAIENIAMGGGAQKDFLAPAMGKIEERFRNFLDSGEMARLLPETQQIAAAQQGVNTRKKAKKNKGGKPRQAFVDTGLYQASFRAWVG